MSETEKSGFRITEGKGFRITFGNGWSISVQFGPGSYISKNRDRLLPSDFSTENHIKMGKDGSLDAEIMVFPPSGTTYEEENPVGWQTPEQFADIIEDISKREKISARDG